MRYLTRSLLIFSAFILFWSAFATTAQAQKGKHKVIYIYRPYYVDPFWRGTLWDPYWYRGYYNPYRQERRERYEREDNVRDARRHLDEDRAKYRADGVITAKEAEKIAKREQTLAKAIRKLDEFNREHRYRY